MSGKNEDSSTGWNPNGDPMLEQNFSLLEMNDPIGLNSLDAKRDASPGRARNSPVVTLPLKMLERRNSDSLFLSTSDEANDDPVLLDSDRPTHRSNISFQAISPRSNQNSARSLVPEQGHNTNITSGGSASYNIDNPTNMGSHISNTYESDFRLPEICNPDSPSSVGKHLNPTFRTISGNDVDDDNNYISRAVLTKSNSELPSVTEKEDMQALRSQLLRSSSCEMNSSQLPGDYNNTTGFQEMEPRFHQLEQLVHLNDQQGPDYYYQRDVQFQLMQGHHQQNQPDKTYQQQLETVPNLQRKHELNHLRQQGMIRDERQINSLHQRQSPERVTVDKLQKHDLHVQYPQHRHQPYQHQLQSQQQHRQQKNSYHSSNNSIQGGKKRISRAEASSRNNNSVHNNVKSENASGGTPHQMKLLRKAAADETLLILRRGTYVCNSGSGSESWTEIDISEQVKEAVDGAVCHNPDYVFPPPSLPDQSVMVVEVMAGTTLSTCKKVWKETGGYVGCLAYASGKFPGGSFIQGSSLS